MSVRYFIDSAEGSYEVKTPTFGAPKVWKIPCAYGASECDGRTFLPHGIGATHHYSCKKGRASIKRRNSRKSGNLNG